MRFVHHCLRVIWANIIGFFYNVYYFLLVALSKKHRDTYNNNINKWNNIKTIADVTAYFKENYKYKWDGYKGIVDHNNFKYEFFCANGDCDDVARWSCKKLRQIGIDADVYGFYDFKAKPMFWHYDCVLSIGGITFLFNYGHNNIVDVSPDKTMKQIYNRSYKFVDLRCWKCKYV